MFGISHVISHGFWNSPKRRIGYDCFNVFGIVDPRMMIERLRHASLTCTYHHRPSPYHGGLKFAIPAIVLSTMPTPSLPSSFFL